jgi:hypothetical protein
VPRQIITAKKVFISNAGVDDASLLAFRHAGDPDQPYNRFYAAMRSWGRYELTDAPGNADLVFEVRFTAPISDCDKMTTRDPQLGVTILDAKTHFTLWTLLEPVEGALRKQTWNRNFDRGMASLMEDLRRLVGPAGGTQK